MFLIVGNGKVARHLSHYFSELDISFACWSRAKNSSEELFELVQRADCVLLAIKDDSLLEFYFEFIARFEKPTIHFSGCLEFDEMISAHPLVAFGPQFFNLDFYRKLPFITTKREQLKIYFKDLPNPILEIKKSEKPYYHALCVMAANFTTLLWQKFFGELHQGFNFPEATGNTLLESVQLNLLRDSTKSLTGPFVRRDFKTINQNLNALTNDKYQDVYKAFLKSYFTPSELKNL